MPTYRVMTEFVVRDEREFYDRFSPLAAARFAYEMAEDVGSDIRVCADDIARYIVVELDEDGHETHKKHVFNQNFVEIPF